MPEQPPSPPPHVLSAFGLHGAGLEPVLLGAVPAWQSDGVTLRPVADTVAAAWSAGVLEELMVDGVRLARPVRASDGRWVVGGWAACRPPSGRPEPRHDEVVAAAQRLHAALAPLPRPRFLDERDDLLSRADAAAWAERFVPLDPDTGGRLFAALADRRVAVRPPSQVVHGDLFGTVLFDGDAAPGIIELVPFWRPPQWAAAVVVVDALAWGGADDALAIRWQHLDCWPQVLLRALLYRLAMHAQHPQSSVESLAGLRRVASLVVARL